MTDSFVTQCPHCRTSFRISRAQLNAAHGAVRCGACMHVFNAAQQLLVDQTRASKPAPQAARPTAPTAHPRPPAATATTSTPPPPAVPTASKVAVEPRTSEPKQSVDTLWIHDDLDLDNLDLDEELAKLEEQEMQLSQDFLSLKDAPESPSPLLDTQEETRDPHNEDWAESLLRAEQGDVRLETRPLSPARPASVASATVASPPPRTAPSITLDNARHLDDLDEDPPLTPLKAEREEAELSARDADEIDDRDYSLPNEPTSKGKRNEPALRNDSLLDLEEEPLQLDWQEVKKPWGRWFGWVLLNLLAVLALGSQYVTYHFEELARQDQYRPWFEQLCPEIGCTLPSKVDIEQIKSSNLVVRSHPDFRNSLVVDAIIYNRASFAQPFPLLELRFADMSGQLLASRRFKPSDYLGGELAGQAEMPPQTPIHVSLEIIDPGTKAVNYSLSFHSPE
ncbi:DUF3426 domain-containing protein [Pseudomonas sp. Marseille-Q8238]